MQFLDPDLLRTFLAFVDGGSLARAAAIVARSPSAVTAQMQRLEEIVGAPLLATAGRGRSLTAAGEELVGHARRILSVHREAWLSLKGARADGQVALGATQDFADSGLPVLLRQFASSHPRVRIDLRIGRTAELTQAFEEGGIDVLIAMRQSPAPDEAGVIREPMLWMGAAGGLAGGSEAEVPLALLDAPCGFRSAATASLDQAGRSYRIAATSPSLSGLRAAVSAGIAVTVRTARWSDAGIGDVGQRHGLPALGHAEFTVRRRADAGPAAEDLAALVCDGLGAEVMAPRRTAGRRTDAAMPLEP
jgi:DNA-binding transcriptional LysR family regulator